MTPFQILVTGNQQVERLPLETDPSPLAADELTGQMVYSLISSGTEMGAAFMAIDRFPRRPGYAAVWRVDAVGSSVADVRPGDLVFSLGHHRTHHRAKRESVVPLPPGLSPIEATFARMMGVSMTTLDTTRARPPARVLITGLGMVGHLAAKIFAACGYEVTAVDPDARRRRWASAGGIKNVIERVPTEDKVFVGTPALVIDCSGHEQAVLDGCEVVRTGGEVVLVGTPWRKMTDVSAWKMLNTIFFRFVHLRSGWECELPMLPAEHRVGNQMACFNAAIQWLADGRVSVSGLYNVRSPLDVADVYATIRDNKSDTLVTILDWQSL